MRQKKKAITITPIDLNTDGHILINEETGEIVEHKTYNIDALKNKTPKELCKIICSKEKGHHSPECVFKKQEK